MIDLNLDLPNLGDLAKQAKKQEQDIQKAVDRTVNDIRQRGPAVITKAVTAVYGIKSGEVTAAGKAAKAGAKTVGEVKIHGVNVKNLHLTYRGRRLTPLHFSMTPRTRPPRKVYSVKAAIFKGQKKKLIGKAKYDTPVFLAPQRQGIVLPFQRMGPERMPVYAIHTTSIPQMIENKTVAADIKKKMDDLFITRLQHNINRLTKGGNKG